MRTRFPKWRVRTMMAAVVAAALVLLPIRPMVPGWLERLRVWHAGRAIRAQLDRPVAMPFLGGVTLGQFLDRVRASTKSPALPDGLPIDIDPVGLQEVDHSLASMVRVNTQAVPVRASLMAALDALGLTFSVKDGLIFITSKGGDDEPSHPDTECDIAYNVRLAESEWSAIADPTRANGDRPGWHFCG